jgi:signal transduction histidine kinase
MRDETLQKLQMDCFVIDFATGSREQADQPEEDEGREDPRFVQIKRQYFKSDVKAYNVIQLVDISKDILYQRTAVEKKLLTVINATVSHEMRNPINSISALNIKQDQVNGRLRGLINRFDSASPMQMK